MGGHREQRLFRRDRRDRRRCRTGWARGKQCGRGGACRHGRLFQRAIGIHGRVRWRVHRRAGRLRGQWPLGRTGWRRRPCGAGGRCGSERLDHTAGQRRRWRRPGTHVRRHGHGAVPVRGLLRGGSRRLWGFGRHLRRRRWRTWKPRDSGGTRRRRCRSNAERHRHGCAGSEADRGRGADDPPVIGQSHPVLRPLDAGANECKPDRPGRRECRGRPSDHVRIFRRPHPASRG